MFGSAGRSERPSVRTSRMGSSVLRGAAASVLRVVSTGGYFSFGPSGAEGVEGLRFGNRAGYDVFL